MGCRHQRQSSRTPRRLGLNCLELRRLIDETDSNGETSAALIARQLVELAKGGDLRAIKECFDRLDGSPRQTAVTISEPFVFGKIVL